MPLPPDIGLLIVIAAGFITGGMIGAVGVGGVLLAPLLVLLAGFDVHSAIATSSWSFLFTGVAGTYAYLRRGTVDWRAAAWISIAIVPAAVLGAWANTQISGSALVLILAVLVSASGLRELLSPPTATRRSAGLPPARVLVLLGLVVGFGSSFTGTGGPVLLVPLLLHLRVPALAAVGVSQIVQIPIAVFATLGYGFFGQIDFAVGTAVGLTQALGVLAGAGLAHSLPGRTLGRVVAIALLGTAGLLLIRLG